MVRRPTLARNSYHATILTLVRIALQLTTIPILIRGIGLAGYGIWAVLIAVMNISLLSLSALSSALSVHLSGQSSSEDPNSSATLVRASLILMAGVGCLMGALLYLASGLLAESLFPTDTAEALGALRFLSFAMIPMTVRHWAMGIEAGMQRFDLQALAESLSLAFTALGLILLALGRNGPGVLAGWYLVATVVSVPIHLVCINKLIRIRFRLLLKADNGTRSLMATMSRFGIRQWISQVGTSFFGQFDRVIVNLFLGPTAAGIYAAMTAAASQVNVLSAGPISVIVPAIGSRRDPGARRKVYEAARRLNQFIAILVAVSLMILAVPIVHFLAPEAFPDAVPVLQILVMAYAFYSLAAVGFYAAQGIGKPEINTKWVLISGGLFTLVLALSTNWYGLIGAAWANVAYGLVLVINFRIERDLGMSRRQVFYGTGPLLLGLVGIALINLWLNGPGASPLMIVVAVLAQIFATAFLLKRFIARPDESIFQYLRGQLRKIRSIDAIDQPEERS